MKEYYMVNYTYIKNKQEIPCQRLFTVPEGETINSVLFSYFCDFFGDDTIVMDHNYYHSNLTNEQIRLGGWTPVLDEDAPVLKKYFP